MKRISQGSSTSLNDAFESLKPLFKPMSDGSKGNPPYYDPNDLHAHIWKRGKLGVEDNPKIPTYSKNKLSVKDCVYCKVCHMIKDPFQSTVGCNKDIIDDIIVIPGNTQTSDYRIIENYEEHVPFEIKNVSKKEIIVPKKINQKLFHRVEGIFDDYVKIEED
jgi:hypothetical protein